MSFCAELTLSTAKWTQWCMFICSSTPSVFCPKSICHVKVLLTKQCLPLHTKHSSRRVKVVLVCSSNSNVKKDWKNYWIWGNLCICRWFICGDMLIMQNYHNSCCIQPSFLSSIKWFFEVLLVYTQIFKMFPGSSQSYPSLYSACVRGCAATFSKTEVL